MSASGAATAPTKFLFVGDADSPAYRGLVQGLAEARLQGDFLGYRYTLDVADEVRPNTVSDYSVVFYAGSGAQLFELSAGTHAAVLNITASDDALRHRCPENLLHIIPSASMLADALAQWRQKHPGTAATPRAWHPTFKKYAAAQLNIRYRERFAEAMQDTAWAGWAAMKLVTDMIVRGQSNLALELLHNLRTKLAFDGQKGIDMQFRPNGQLAQPLLLTAGGKIVGEAPVRGVANTLESLGESDCPK